MRPLRVSRMYLKDRATDKAQVKPSLRRQINTTKLIEPNDVSRFVGGADAVVRDVGAQLAFLLVQLRVRPPFRGLDCNSPRNQIKASQPGTHSALHDRNLTQRVVSFIQRHGLRTQSRTGLNKIDSADSISAKGPFHDQHAGGPAERASGGGCRTGARDSAVNSKQARQPTERREMRAATLSPPSGPGLPPGASRADSCTTSRTAHTKQKGQPK